MSFADHLKSTRESLGLSQVEAADSLDRFVRNACYCGKLIANESDWQKCQPGEGKHLCWGECGVSADEAWPRLMARIQDLEKTLATLDQLMAGDPCYENAWINYPTKPEVSPAKMVRDILANAPHHQQPEERP